ncbi:MAG: hypothetical protein ACOZAA_17075 [Pseudomonadota bacterium]
MASVPQSSVGAPIPIVIAEEHNLAVLYYVERIESEWDGSTVHIVGPETQSETVAVASFLMPYAHKFGPPNDEAICGHPLFRLGLEPYSSFEVTNSAWINELRQRNSVHPHHKDSQFSSLRHFILTFHDSTFEVVAKSYTAEIISNMSVLQAASDYLSKRREMERTR